MVKIGVEEVASNIGASIGIENELMTINNKGFLVPSSQIIVNEVINDILNQNTDIPSLRQYLYGIQWEPHPSQIEIVTHPLDYHKVGRAISTAWRYLAKVASRKKILIYVGSVHPIQSNPFPLNGTHISISITSGKRKIMPRRYLVYVHNNIRRYLPELIALTANSPIIAGELSGYMSSRLLYSRVLKPSFYARIKRRKTTLIPREKRELLKYALVFTSDKKYEHKVVASSFGLRFLDITPRGPYTNIIEDNWASPKVSRIEVRFLDNPSSIEYLEDIAYILLGLAVQAVHLLKKKEKIPEPKYLNENRMRAIKDGAKALVLDDSGKLVPIKDRISNMLNAIYPYLDSLGLKLKTTLARGIPEIEYYGIPPITSDNRQLLEMIKSAKLFLEISVSGSRELISFDGSKRMLNRKTITGIAFPEYNLDWIVNKEGTVARFRRIHIGFWLLTRHGYLKILDADKIISAKTTTSKLISILKKIGTSI